MWSGSTPRPTSTGMAASIIGGGAPRDPTALFRLSSSPRTKSGVIPPPPLLTDGRFGQGGDEAEIGQAPRQRLHLLQVAEVPPASGPVVIGGPPGRAALGHGPQ